MKKITLNADNIYSLEISEYKNIKIGDVLAIRERNQHSNNCYNKIKVVKINFKGLHYRYYMNNGKFYKGYEVDEIPELYTINDNARQEKVNKIIDLNNAIFDSITVLNNLGQYVRPSCYGSDYPLRYADNNKLDSLITYLTNDLKNLQSRIDIHKNWQNDVYEDEQIDYIKSTIKYEDYIDDEPLPF